MKLVNRRVNFFTVIAGVRFHPGLNTLSDSDYQKVKDSKAFKSELDCRNMEISGAVETETTNAVEATKIKDHAGKIAEEIKSLKVDKASELIAKIDDPTVLSAIKRTDGRVGIHELVDKRLVVIDSQAKDDLVKESKVAPNGTGEDFVVKIGDSQADIEGKKAHTAIPAMQGK